jgi:RHS repeat-associated protein
MRQGSSTVYWLLGDYLGSTAITASSSGSKVGELRYKAWGETRYSSGTTPTSFRYTGQRLVGYIELYQMGARWYDPYLNRFLSPDSIIPDFSNPQNLNRYSYVNNRPLNAIDPSGHYGIEVHEKLTYNQTFEAVKAKVASYELTADQAKQVEELVASQVAAGDQGTDCMVCADSSASPTGRMHWLTQEGAESRARAAASTTTLSDFGRIMHGVQDSYSHRGSGYTYWPGLAGAAEYLSGVVFGGAKFDWGTLGNSFQFGHSGTSFHTRGDFMGLNLTMLGGGTWAASLDPDDYDPTNPVDAAMTAKSQELIELYIAVYLDWVWGLSEDEIGLWNQATQDAWHILHDSDESQ